MIPLKISAWNVHALMDKAGSNRPQCRGGGGAFVGKEIGRINLALQR